MRIPSSHHKRRRDDDTTMTSMIDVVFLLLIFFVCASVGQVQENLLPTELSGGSITAAEVAAAERPLGEAWVRLIGPGTGTSGIRVEVEGRTFAGPERYRALAQFLGSLAEAAPDLPVILDIDPEVPLGEALAAYDAARVADFDAIHFAIDIDKPDRRSGSAARR